MRMLHKKEMGRKRSRHPVGPRALPDRHVLCDSLDCSFPGVFDSAAGQITRSGQQRQQVAAKFSPIRSAPLPHHPEGGGPSVCRLVTAEEGNLSSLVLAGRGKLVRLPPGRRPPEERRASRPLLPTGRRLGQELTCCSAVGGWLFPGGWPRRLRRFRSLGPGLLLAELLRDAAGGGLGLLGGRFGVLVRIGSGVLWRLVQLLGESLGHLLLQVGQSGSQDGAGQGCLEQLEQTEQFLVGHRVLSELLPFLLIEGVGINGLVGLAQRVGEHQPGSRDVSFAAPAGSTDGRWPAGLRL